MKTFLRWKKDIFSSTYKIYSNEKLVGNLKDKSFSQSADGVLTGEHFSFKTRGFFKQNTTIVDKKDNTVIGTISYNNWMTKATIKIKNRESVWKYDNLWNTKWSINGSDGIKIKYTGTATSGLINSNTEDALFLLSGLYVTNYYRQVIVAAIIAALVPTWLIIMN